MDSDPEKSILQGATNTESGPISHNELSLVDFEGEYDAENPLNWPKSYKWLIIGLTSAMCLTVCVLLSGYPNTLVNNYSERSQLLYALQLYRKSWATFIPTICYTASFSYLSGSLAKWLDPF